MRTVNVLGIFADPLDQGLIGLVAIDFDEGVLQLFQPIRRNAAWCHDDPTHQTDIGGVAQLLDLTFGALAAVGSRSRQDASGLRVATLVALGIGLHNFGEGVAIGASLAVNELALGTFLVVGFTLHNVTEGVGVVSPLAQETVAAPTFAGLAALAGLPVVPGVWLGAFAFAPHWAAILFGIGAGAVLQVVVEIDRFLHSRVRDQGAGRFSSTSTVAKSSIQTPTSKATTSG